MIPVALSLKEKNVCIVGGGRVALRKAKQYIMEGARVYVLSPSFLSSLTQLDVICIQAEYHPKYLEDMFLVYAATNHLSVNHQIIEDCQKRNILCGSATYEECSFYSMSYQQHSLATIALSMHQKLPYHQPLLQEMIHVLDQNQERLEMMLQLRPYILQWCENKKGYFERLYTCDLKILSFLLQSVQKNKGTIFIYHQSQYIENYQFSIEPSLVLSFQEFQEHLDLFIFPMTYHVVLLVLYEGVVYQRMIENIPLYWTYSRPLIDCEHDISQILSCLHSQKETLYVMHPRNSSYFKEMLMQNIPQENLYDLYEDMTLCQKKSYQVIMLLMTHGQHYHDYLEKVKKLQEIGYDIEFLGILLDHPQIIEYIEKRETKHS